MQKIRILCVDDDDDIRDLEQMALGLDPIFEVSAVNSGERALEWLQSNPADAILLDVMMPGLDGRSVLGRMRADPALADIPVIFVTARVMPDQLAELVEKGATGVVSKPFDPIDLAKRVRGILKVPGSA